MYHLYAIGDNGDEGQDASLRIEMGNPNQIATVGLCVGVGFAYAQVVELRGQQDKQVNRPQGG